MTIKTIRARLEDASVVAPLFDQYRVFYHQPSDPSLAEQFIRQRLSHDESIIFLALSGASEAIGFTQLYPFFSSVAAQRVWVLNDLYVAEHWRGSGAGSALLSVAKAFAEQTHAKGLALETQVSNRGAQRLYESMGYRRDDETYHYFLETDQ